MLAPESNSQPVSWAPGDLLEALGQGLLEPGRISVDSQVHSREQKRKLKIERSHPGGYTGITQFPIFDSWSLGPLTAGDLETKVGAPLTRFEGQLIPAQSYTHHTTLKYAPEAGYNQVLATIPLPK